MKKEYLKENRLQEVIGLIQVLAYDKNTSRSEVGLQDDLGYNPISAKSWLEVVSMHPEFFRIWPEESQTKRTALVSRYVLDYEKRGDGEEKRPILSPDQVSRLIDIAIQMHDKQVTRSKKWQTFIPLISVIIVATASIVVALIKSNGGN